MENNFLRLVGYWNLVGSLALYLMLNRSIADKILRQWTEIIAYPYDVGKYGAMWLLWAATTNLFFSLVNIFAADWEVTSQMIIICGDLLVYGILLFPAIAALRSEDYRRGHVINVALGIFWIFWAIYSLVTYQ